MIKLRYVYYVLLVAATVALDQLTRNTDLPHAIGWAVIMFVSVIGAAVCLGALALGGITLYWMVLDGGDQMLRMLRTLGTASSIQKAQAQR